MVVLSIMMLLMGGLVLDFNRNKKVRMMTIAKNETTTNLRKVQGYMMSSRNIEDGNNSLVAKYYLVEFRDGSPTYQVKAIDKDFQVYNVETMKFPGGIAVTGLDAGYGPTDCLQIIYSAPFGTMYTNYTDEQCGDIADILRDPIKKYYLTKVMAYVNLQGIGHNSEDDRYIQINPITGQITTD